MQKTFGPVVFQDGGTDSYGAKCYGSGYDCSFRIGDVCTHVRPSRKIDTLPDTPDWCEMKDDMLSDARDMAQKEKQRRISVLTEPAVGQIWKEVDPRKERYVRVERVDIETIMVRRVIRPFGSWTHAARSPERWAKASRFNGKRGGYEFHASE
jgi:hypothetical protein